jgi:hypothetical protein
MVILLHLGAAQLHWCCSFAAQCYCNHVKPDVVEDTHHNHFKVSKARELREALACEAPLLSKARRVVVAQNTSFHLFFSTIQATPSAATVF